MGINQNCMSFGVAASKSVQGIVWEINSLFSAGLHVLFWRGRAEGDWILDIFFFFFNCFFPVWLILINFRKLIRQEEFSQTGISFHSL